MPKQNKYIRDPFTRNFRYPRGEIPAGVDSGRVMGPDDLLELVVRLDEHVGHFLGHQLCYRPAIRDLLRMAYAVSLRPQEGRWPEFVFLIETPPENEKWWSGYVDLHKARLDLELLQRISAAVAPRPYALLIGRSTEFSQVLGMRRSEATSTLDVDHNWSPCVQVHGPGFISVQVPGSNGYAVQLRNGRLAWFDDISDCRSVHSLVHSALEIVGQSPSLFRPHSEEDVEKAEAQSFHLLMRAVSNALATALDLRHGGTVVITDYEDGQPGYARRGLRASHLPLARLARFDRPRDESNTFSLGKADAVLQAAKMLAHLTAVDGAVVLDRSLELRRFGAVFEHPGPPECRKIEPAATTQQANDHWDKLEVYDLSRKGTRHQSAAGFCANHAGTIAFVISQDREIRCFEGLVDDRVVVRGPLSASFTRSAPL